MNKNKNQLLIMILAVGFFVGILYQNILANKNMIIVKLFHKEELQRYLQTQIIAEKYLWYVVKTRIMFLIAVCLLSCIKLKKVTSVICIGMIGFFGGVFVVSAVLQLGMKGILLCLAGVFPQGIFYGLMYWMMLTHWFQYPQKQWNRVKLLFMVALFMIGIIVEVYLNPLIVKAIIRIL